jgi:hypothetical protein
MKISSGWRHDMRHNLTTHLFAEFTERPAWPYVGASRTDPYGRLRPPRDFSLAQYASPGRAFIWTIEDQAWAVGEGFFLHRSGSIERVNVVWIDYFKHGHLNNDGYAGLTELVRRNFYNQSKSPNYYNRAIKFIKQQDEWGYTGAWDKRVQFFSNRLQWYQEFRVRGIPDEQLSQRDRELKQKLIKQHAGSRVSRPHAFATHITNNTDGEEDND